MKIKLIFCSIAIICNVSSPEDTSYGSIDATKVQIPLNIDGDLEDWEHVEWHIVAEGAPFVNGNEFNILRDDGNSEPAGTALTHADLSAIFAIQYDNEFLYFAAKVKDNVRDLNVNSGENWWFLKDAVSLFLDVPRDKDGAAWESGDHSFSFNADDNVGNWWRHGDDTGHRELPMHSSVRSVVNQGTAGDYQIEAAIPMQLLSKYTDW